MVFQNQSLAHGAHIFDVVLDLPFDLGDLDDDLGDPGHDDPELVPLDVGGAVGLYYVFHKHFCSRKLDH